MTPTHPYRGPVITVGLTGGIGSGKTAVSRLLAERGAVVIDADRVAREVVEPGTPGLARVVEAFGEDVVRADGSLDRPVLAGLIFGNDAARNRLDAIVHPLIGERTRALVAQAAREGTQLLVHDLPLLVEAGLGPAYHLVVVVDAPVVLRLARLAGRGLPQEQSRARMAAQADDAQRRAAADVWLDNGGSRQALAARVRRLHDDRLVPYARNLAERRSARRGPVKLVAPREQWPADGARLVTRLRQLCPGADVHHLGSTAVAGLAAEDVIDLQVEVASWPDVEALEDPLATGGFPRRQEVDSDPVLPELDPDPDPVQWRRHLHRSADPGRAASVQVRVAGTSGARAAVTFRDLLRADPQLRQAYAAGKHRLAERNPGDVNAYARGKSGLIVGFLADARRRDNRH